MANNKSKSERKIILFSILGLLVVAGAVASRFIKSTPPIPLPRKRSPAATSPNWWSPTARSSRCSRSRSARKFPAKSSKLNVKEGQDVKKGRLIVQDQTGQLCGCAQFSQGQLQFCRRQSETSRANLEKADLEYKRNDALFKEKLLSESDLLTAKTAYDVAKTTLDAP
jgi:HlyD family secretion protein